MTTPLQPPKKGKLTPLQEQIAMLDAQGLGPSEIAKALDCTARHVTHLRREQWYLDRRQYWIERGISKLTPAIDALKKQALEAHDLALQQAVDALEAVNTEGHPSWQIRLQAIGLIINSPIVRALVAPEGAGPGKDGAAMTAITAIQLHVHQEEDGKMKVLEVIDQEPLEITDGE